MGLSDIDINRSSDAPVLLPPLHDMVQQVDLEYVDLRVEEPDELERVGLIRRGVNEVCRLLINPQEVLWLLRHPLEITNRYGVAGLLAMSAYLTGKCSIIALAAGFTAHMADSEHAGSIALAAGVGTAVSSMTFWLTISGATAMAVEKAVGKLRKDRSEI